MDGALTSCSGILPAILHRVVELDARCSWEEGGWPWDCKRCCLWGIACISTVSTYELGPFYLFRTLVKTRAARAGLMTMFRGSYVSSIHEYIPGYITDWLFIIYLLSVHTLCPWISWIFLWKCNCVEKICSSISLTLRLHTYGYCNQTIYL